MKIKISRQLLFFGILVIFLLTSCAETVPLDACAIVPRYGFWSGLWHGIIAPISFVISLFDDDVAIYAINNTGGWYDFGFVLGAGILFGGGGKAAK
jgi:hypothetical protein